MNNENITYTATQDENGFSVVFHNTIKSPVKISFDDIERFAAKQSEIMQLGEKTGFSEKDELLISLLQMLMIPSKTVH